MIRTLIVDDERLARQRLRRLLQEETDVEIVGECTDGQEAQDFLRQSPVDLMFLDIQMPGTSGLDTLSGMPQEQMPLVVFVTAHGEHALRAFELQAFDYVLKPFEADRFRTTLQRARAMLQRLRGGERREDLASLLQTIQQAQQPSHRERFAIKNGGRMVLVRSEEIDWIEAADNYVCLHVGGTSHVLRETMNSLESQLDGRQFLRIHRSTIVNIDRIKELQPWFRGDYLVLLKDNTELVLSRTFRDRLQKLLGK